jgi:release factor family 10
MLNFPELISLSHTFENERVLSVYVDGAADDPATRRVWRVRLDQSLRDLRTRLAGAPHDERVEFERCVEHLEAHLADLRGAVGAPGWAAFITAEGIQDAEPLPAPMPTMAVWSTGLCVAPYMRSLKQTRPVVVAVADAREVTLQVYRVGEMTPSEAIRAHVTIPPAQHMGTPPRVGFHGGVRGTTGRDAEQRALLEGTRRMTGDAARRAVHLAGPDGWIVAGGTPQASARLVRAIARLAPDRVLQLETIDVHASPAELVAAAEEGASALRDRRDLAAIAEMVADAGAGGRTALGNVATREALGQGRVRELYLTRRFLEEHTADAEDAVRAALAQGAAVEEVSRAVAARLDDHGGMGARLRYALPSPEVDAQESADLGIAANTPG